MNLFISAEIGRLVDELGTLLSGGRRIMLGIVGAPGSGKSTLAAQLQEFFTPETAAIVPMDGFHLANAIIDGTPLRERKGAIDTFDAGGYLSLLKRLEKRNETVVYAPAYRRGIEEPIAASIAIPASVSLVITEGNYLLAHEPPWQRIRALLHEVWFVDTPHELRLARLVERHVAFGMDRVAAESWATGSDETNSRLIESTRLRADRIIPWT